MRYVRHCSSGGPCPCLSHGVPRAVQSLAHKSNHYSRFSPGVRPGPIRDGPVVQTAKQNVCLVSCSVRHRPTLPCLFSGCQNTGQRTVESVPALPGARVPRPGRGARGRRRAPLGPVRGRTGLGWAGPGRAEEPRHRPPPAPLAGPGRRGRAAGTAAGSPGRGSRDRRRAPPYHGGGSLQPPR